MKKILFSLIALMLVVGLSLGYATPVQAAGGTVMGKLLDSNDNGLAGGVLKYYAPSPISGWVTVGTTGDDGTVSGYVPLDRTAFTMYYAGGSQQVTGVDVTTNPTLIFTTTPVTVKLETCDGTPLAGEAYWNAGSALGGYLLIGTTPATKELLPGTYSFKVRYDNRQNVVNATIGTTPAEVVFKTTKVSIWFTGTIYYYVPAPISGWQTFTSPKEMLPGSYDFKFGSLTSPTKTIIISGCSMEIGPFGGINQPPELDPAGNKTVNEGQLLQFTISATDPDGDPLTYSASNLPSGATFEPMTRVFSWTPGYDQAGTYPNVHFEVSDGSLTDSEDITITVVNVNRPPVVNSVTANPSQLWPSNHKAVDVVITLDATDLDGDSLRITYSVADEYGIYNISETDLPEDGVIFLIAWRDGEDKDGRIYTITVTVYDAKGLSYSKSVEVVVPHDQGKRGK